MNDTKHKQQIFDEMSQESNNKEKFNKKNLEIIMIDKHEIDKMSKESNNKEKSNEENSETKWITLLDEQNMDKYIMSSKFKVGDLVKLKTETETNKHTNVTIDNETIYRVEDISSDRCLKFVDVIGYWHESYFKLFNTDEKWITKYGEDQIQILKTLSYETTLDASDSIKVSKLNQDYFTDKDIGKIWCYETQRWINRDEKGHKDGPTKVYRPKQKYDESQMQVLKNSLLLAVSQEEWKKVIEFAIELLIYKEKMQ